MELREPGQRIGLLLGPGDDCAALAPETRGPLVVGVDQLVGGRHFAPGTPPRAIARKALARAISDVAAMGARPLWALAAGTLPDDYADADALCAAFAELGDALGCPVIGGDLARGGAGVTQPVLSVTAAGVCDTPRGLVRRGDARPGDGVWVTGALGGSFASGRHLSFDPRCAEALSLCALSTIQGEPALGAMIDLSDGLGRDADRVARASGVRVDLHAELLPLHEGVADWRAAAGEGEDYELLLTLRPGVEAALGTSTDGRPSVGGTPMTRIGTVSSAAEGSAGAWIRPPGSDRPEPAGEMGWDHAP